MKKLLLITGTALALTLSSVGAAMADDCTGRDHDTGTVVGGVGGAAIGGLASHSVGGALVGGVVGALAGNAIDRSQDCTRQADRQERRDERDAYNQGRVDAYNQGYDDRAQEEYVPPPVVETPVPAYDNDDVTVYREPGDPYP